MTVSSRVHVIVGAGQAGAYAAMAMRRAGFGGRIVLVGDEEQHPYDRTPLSKALMVSNDRFDLTYFFDTKAYRDQNIDLHLGAAVEAIDLSKARLEVAGLGGIPYDRLILATGSRPNVLDAPGAERILKLRTVADAQDLRRRLIAGGRMVCIGAGVIGLELASAARAWGCEVTVVEIAQSVMVRSLDPGIGAHIAARHRRAGVNLLFGNEVTAIEDDAVILKTGERLMADIVVAGVGVRRNISLASAAGIATDRGILIDGMGRTNIEGIYAAGEVAEFYSKRSGGHITLESWRHAQEHGTHIGRVAAGVEEIYDEVPWFWSDQHGDNLQVAGVATGTAQTLFRGDPQDDSFSAFFLDTQDRLVGAFGLNAGRDVSAAIRLMRRGGSVVPDVLVDTAIKPQQLVTAAAVHEVAG